MILNLIIEIVDFVECGRICHLGGFDSMGITPTGCADDLPTILGILKNDPKSRSVNNSLQQLIFYPNSIKDVFDQPKLRPVDQAELYGIVSCIVQFCRWMILGCFFKYRPLTGWDPSNQLQAEISSNLRLTLLKVFPGAAENKLFRLGCLCKQRSPHRMALFLDSEKMTLLEMFDRSVGVLGIFS